MPLDAGLRKVLVVGSGPIVIGQAAEFDYAGTQACRALREEGVEVVLINSNPATIMTDHDTADSVYLEPLDLEGVCQVLAKERPQGVIGTLGGQVGLNLSLELFDSGALERFGARLLGTGAEAIRRGEDRRLFRDLMRSIGEDVPLSHAAESVEEALAFGRAAGFPLVVRPAFTLGGTGGGMARGEEELAELASSALDSSPVGQALVEVSVEGWKEIEFEVVRDGAGNKVLVCGMENLDPMGVHTGDSVVVSPIMTLGESLVADLKGACFRIVDAIGVEGACNIQFAVGSNGKRYVIEVNPRASRSSALASKATAYPIARVAAKVALGFRLDEIELWSGGPRASEEPVIYHVALKFPRWPFDKFPNAQRRLGTRMRSTGEVMGLGDTFEEAFVKALRGLDQGTGIFDPAMRGLSDMELRERVTEPWDRRFFAVMEAIERGWSVDEVASLSGVDGFFVERIAKIVWCLGKIASRPVDRSSMGLAKSLGIGDDTLSALWGVPEERVSKIRESMGLKGVLKPVGGREGFPYRYRSLGGEEMRNALEGKGVLVLGAGPVRIGQGIEFDCCSVRALRQLRRMGLKAVMVNNNPETVSTDHDEADLLCFEPIEAEVVLDVMRHVSLLGVLPQFGGQRGLSLAVKLAELDVPVLGVEPWAVEISEDREKFYRHLDILGIAHPEGITAWSKEEAVKGALKMGFPLVVRPSYVLGGLGMEVVCSMEQLEGYLGDRWDFTGPLLMDQFLGGIEAEADVLCDGKGVFVPCVMEHLEGPGVHSGDSVAAVPHRRLSAAAVEAMVEVAGLLGRSLNVRGIFNVQFVAEGDRVWVLEANLRSSRTVPFVSKVTGVPMADMAVRLALGEALSDLGLPYGLGKAPSRWAVKVPVFSMGKIDGAEAALGPNMRSTGEVMAFGETFEEALLKGFRSAGHPLEAPFGVLVSLGTSSRALALGALRELSGLGCGIWATDGTGRFLSANGLPCKTVSPDEALYMVGSSVKMVVNTTSPDWGSGYGFALRRRAAERGVLCLTSLDTLAGVAEALRFMEEEAL
ncbi:MAG: carbamoyl-phosphate synthase large subunit [Thermanaerothrix sp.]|nr:carbamoyl-phosphate synthase large subunit [Thermanaerothrix sp.]